jgi:hypothetical protein
MIVRRGLLGLGSGGESLTVAVPRRSIEYAFGQLESGQASIRHELRRSLQDPSVSAFLRLPFPHRARTQPLEDRSAGAVPARDLANEGVNVRVVRGDDGPKSFVVAMHAWPQSLDGGLPDEAIRVFGEEPNGSRDHFVLSGATFTFLALIARECMERSCSNTRLLMPEVLHKFRNRISIEEVVENIAAANADSRVRML